MCNNNVQDYMKKIWENSVLQEENIYYKKNLTSIFSFKNSEMLQYCYFIHTNFNFKQSVHLTELSVKITLQTRNCQIKNIQISPNWEKRGQSFMKLVDMKFEDKNDICTISLSVVSNQLWQHVCMKSHFKWFINYKHQVIKMQMSSKNKQKTQIEIKTILVHM